ncbi:hypothetical protein AB0442_38390 [Kitasatospora sp. NPDC085895]|uniref:hypothetical protein n=1 Tax=Kitasatospora sp. NPDC085895 TaxID=3155057 RepID=UPI00344FD8E8
MDADLYTPRRIAPNWRAQELLVALIQAAGGELTFAGEHMLTTSTRDAGGDIRDVLYEPLPDGTIRLSLAQSDAGPASAGL